MSISGVRSPAIPNFRDIGGAQVVGGARVRSGQLFRSVAPVDLAEPGARFLDGLGIRTVFDLRTATERAHGAARLPRGARGVRLDVLADGGSAGPAAMYDLMRDPRRASAALADGGAERFFLAAYPDMVRLPSARHAYGELLRALARDSARPALVHCTTGKDRTGWAVAVLQMLLGVPAKAVMEEYLASDVAIRAAYRPVVDEFVARGGDRRVIEPLMGVQASFLEAALDELESGFGSLEGYLSDGLGLDTRVQEALCVAFLEAPVVPGARKA